MVFPPCGATGVSEQFREEEEAGQVARFTAKTLEAAVLDDTKDVIVLFHAQVCKATPKLLWSQTSDAPSIAR